MTATGACSPTWLLVQRWLGGSAATQERPRRRTFNLDMIEVGWGVLFLVHPSLPADPADHQLAVVAATTAWEQRRGMWAEFGDDLLLPYEYRACVCLGTIDDPDRAIAEASSRICYDLRAGTDLGPYGYHRVPPSARLWVWRDQQQQATAKLAQLFPVRT